MGRGVALLRSLVRRVRRASTPRGSGRGPGKSPRRLSCEPLENRQLLSITVQSLTWTESGFVAQFSQAIDPAPLNLYDSQSAALGAADVTLHGAATGDVAGSLVVQGDKLTFVKTGGPLAADNYTVTLRSADTGIRSLASGELLDGDNNGTAGGNYTATHAVAAPEALVVSVADFARGPGQAVNVPAAQGGQASTEGLTVRLSNGQGVTTVQLTLKYDPNLLTISDVELGPDAPTGSSLTEKNLTTPGEAKIAFVYSGAGLPSGPLDILSIRASVPKTATYGAAAVLDIVQADLKVTAGSESNVLDATADDALQVVAFPGDANKNGRYDLEDARLIARVGADLDTGFAVDPAAPPLAQQYRTLYPAIDALVLGDVTAAGGLSALDASDLMRQVLGLSTPDIPAIPAGPFAPIDVVLSNGSLLNSRPAGTVVGDLTTLDPDTTDTFTYTLVSGTGDTNNSSFEIAGNQLKTKTTLAAGTYKVRVKSTDAGSRSVERAFTILVTQNQAPTAVTLSASTVAENQAAGAVVGTFSTTDPNSGDTFTYALVSGTGDTGNASFEIVGNQLKTKAAFNRETQSSYSIRVKSTDSGGLSTEQTFTITVTNVNEAPTAIALSANSLSAGQPSGTVVGTLSTTDPDTGDTFTYSLVAGTDDTNNSSFTISGNQIKTASSLAAGTYKVRVKSTDAGGLSAQQAFTITVTSNQAPTAIALSTSTVAENQAAGAVVGTLSTTDPNSGDTFTYALVSGTGSTDNASFEIAGNQLKTKAAFDRETKSSYSIRVKSTDAGGLSFEQTFTITVSNVNETPTAVALSANSLSAGQPSGTAVGTLSTTDPDTGDTFTYTLVAGTDDTNNSSFTITGNQLKTASSLTAGTYKVRVKSTDAGGLSAQQAFTITVGTNQAPTAIALSTSTVAENKAAGEVVGTFTTTDPNASDTFTYTLVSGTGGTDNASFEIAGNQLKTKAAFDRETKSSYSIRVKSTDAGGLSFEQTFTITVTNVNETPTAVALSSNSLLGGQPSGTVVGTLSTTDPDASDTFTYSLVAGSGDTDNSSFTITGNQLKTASSLAAGTYTVRVKSTDVGGLSAQQSFTITVNANHAPTAIALSADTLLSGQAAGTAVGTLTTTDADTGDAFTYSLVAGTGDTHNGSFEIAGDQLKTKSVLTAGTYTVRVKSVDKGGASIEQAFTITVNTNHAPTAIALSANTLAAGQAAGTVVGNLTTTDADTGDAFTYSLVSGAGDTNNSSFAIANNQLKTATSLGAASYSVRVKSTDKGGLTVEQTFTITVA